MEKKEDMSIKVNSQIKAEVEEIYSKHGMTIADAINVFLYQSKLVGGLPFDMKVPDTEAVSFASLKGINKNK